MAFKNLNMSVIAYCNGFTMWHYSTKDSIEDIIKDSSYFKSIYTLCALGDVIYITSNGKTSIYQVSKIDKDLVELTAM